MAGEVRTIATCICEEQTQVPPQEEWNELRDAHCDDPDCYPLDKCRQCHFRQFLTRWCNCDCDECTIVSFTEIEVEDKNDPGYGLTGCTRIPKEHRWNPALNEYVETTGDVERLRKEKGLEYVPDDKPPKPYETSDSEEAKEKRRQFAEDAVNVEVTDGKD